VGRHLTIAVVLLPHRFCPVGSHQGRDRRLERRKKKREEKCRKQSEEEKLAARNPRPRAKTRPARDESAAGKKTNDVFPARVETKKNDEIERTTSSFVIRFDAIFV
jgi:hypothetical protein